jgi:hypothetical protein
MFGMRGFIRNLDNSEDPYHEESVWSQGQWVGEHQCWFESLLEMDQVRAHNVNLQTYPSVYQGLSYSQPSTFEGETVVPKCGHSPHVCVMVPRKPQKLASYPWLY